MRRMYWLYLVMFLALTACGAGGGGGAGASFFPGGTDPDFFTFGTKTNVTVSTLVQSDDVIPTGYNYPATVQIINGEYSLDAGGTWSSSTGTISPPGGKIRVRHTSASTNNTQTITYLSIGDTMVTFTSVTAATNEPFAIVNVLPKSNVNPNTLVTLNGSTSTGAPPLNYSWTFTPAAGSSSALSSLTAVSPTFKPDVTGPLGSAGTYTAQLTVTNAFGSSTSAPVIVTVTPLVGPIGNPNDNTAKISVYNVDKLTNDTPSTTSTPFTMSFIIANSGPEVGSVTLTVSSKDNSGNTLKFCNDATCAAKSDTKTVIVNNVSQTDQKGLSFASTTNLWMSPTDFGNINPNGWTATNLTSP